jgi:hypothetical protein
MVVEQAERGTAEDVGVEPLLSFPFLRVSFQFTGASSRTRRRGQLGRRQKRSRR